MGNGIRPKLVNISREGKMYYAYLCGLSQSFATGVGQTPINAAKNLAREIRKEIIKAVEHDPRVIQDAKKPLRGKRAR